MLKFFDTTDIPVSRSINLTSVATDDEISFTEGDVLELTYDEKDRDEVAAWLRALADAVEEGLWVLIG